MTLQKELELFHSSTALNYKATDFHWGGEMYRIQLEKRNTCWIMLGISRSKYKVEQFYSVLFLNN